MAARKFLLADPAKPEGSDNPHTRAKIEDAAIAVMAEGARLTHDAVAERAGISRRTVYRYYPDQESLRAGAWRRMSPGARMPGDLGEWLAGLDDLYGKFDANADAMIVALSSAEGRAIRNVMTEERVAAFRQIFGEATAGLEEPRRTHAIAVLQFITSGFAWREMRDQWGLDAPAIAAASRWAVETLLTELRKGGGPKG